MMPNFKNIFEKFIGGKTEEKKEVLAPEDETAKEPEAPETVGKLNADEEERLGEGNQIRKMAERAAEEAEKSDKAERPEDEEEKE